MFYMHVHGHGTAAELAQSLTCDRSHRQVEQRLGAVDKFTLPRDDLKTFTGTNDKAAIAGPAGNVAFGFKAAVDELGQHGDPSSPR
jgi:hypothetical protein